VDTRFTPSEDGDYIEVVVEGDITREGAAEFTAAIYKLGEELGIRCFLFDLTKSHNVQPVVDGVNFTLEDLPDIEPPNVTTRTAALVDPADQSHDFQIAFSRQHGFDASLFWDRAKAIRYLKEAAPRLNRSPP